MKTNDVIKLTGLSKQTLLYYEKEGMINPIRDDNNYRNYNEKDIQILECIKLLRSMDINIDDVKSVIHDQISFKECLENQEKHIDYTLENLSEVKTTLKKFKDRNLPIIPALQDINDVIINNWTLGYPKTTKTIVLGRRLTKALLIRTFIIQLLVALPLGGIIALLLDLGINDEIRYGTPLWMLMTSLVWLFQVLVLAKGAGNMGFIASKTGTSAYQNNPLYYIEFLEDGVQCYERGGIIQQLKHFKELLSGKEDLKYYTYEQIDKAIITTKKRYVGIGPLSKSVMTYDFTLEFFDGNRYYLYNPITIDGDLKYAFIIIKEKVKNIEDKGHALKTILESE